MGTKGKQEIVAEAMDILRPLYEEYSDDTVYRSENLVAKELLNKMTTEATTLFLKENKPFSSVLQEVALDYADGVEGGMIPGLCYKEDLVSFYNKNAEAVVAQAEKFCDMFTMDFSDISERVLEDPMVKNDDTKKDIVKFVVGVEARFLRDEISPFRDKLEKISKEKVNTISLTGKKQSVHNKVKSMDKCDGMAM